MIIFGLFFFSFFKPLTKRRRYAAAAAIGKRLYVVGGYDGRQRMNSVECLDLSQENATWQPVASLTYRRALPGVCVHQSKSFFVTTTEEKNYLDI